MRRLRDSEGARIVLGAALTYMVAWIWLHWFQFLTPHLSEPDPHYHIKAAWLMRTRGVLDAFPWAEASLWREVWFNKDFGFHVLLLPFTFGELISGAKYAAVTYGALVYASFYAVLRLTGARHAWFWVLLLLFAGGFFGYRVNVPRPQLLSMVLTLWVLFFVLRRSLVGTGVTTAIYALSYAAPHVAVGYAGVRWLSEGLAKGRWAPWLPLAALAGLLVGWTVHPSFPDTFVGWWVQNVGVLSATWSSGAHSLAMAAELQPADTRSMLFQHVPLFALAVGGALAWPMVQDRKDPALATLLAVALGYLVLTLLSRRFIEYLIPVGLWALALVYSRAWPSLSALSFRWRALGAAAALCLLMIGAHRTIVENHRNFSSFPFKGIPLAAAWLHEHTPRDSLVFTCDWDDAPELFLYNHRNTYLVFLDPAFMFKWRPALWDTWRATALGQDPDPVRTIRDALGASGGFCTGEYTGLRRQLEADPRVKLSGASGAAYVFAFVDPPPDDQEQLDPSASPEETEATASSPFDTFDSTPTPGAAQ